MGREASYFLNRRLKEVLACPYDQSDLEYQKEGCILKCRKCQRTFRISKGIPEFMGNLK